MANDQFGVVGSTVWHVLTGARGTVEGLADDGRPVVRFDGSVKGVPVSPSHVRRTNPIGDWHTNWTRDRQINP